MAPALFLKSLNERNGDGDADAHLQISTTGGLADVPAGLNDLQAGTNSEGSGIPRSEIDRKQGETAVTGLHPKHA